MKSAERKRPVGRRIGQSCDAFTVEARAPRYRVSVSGARYPLTEVSTEFRYRKLPPDLSSDAGHVLLRMGGVMAAVVIIVWVVCAVLCASVASRKGHSGCLWGLLGLVFGFFALIIIAVMPSARREPITVNVNAPSFQAPPRTEPASAPLLASPAPQRKEKTCPDCAESVLADAKVCRHCGYRFDGAGGTKAIEAPRTAPSYESEHRAAATVLKALAEAAGPVTRLQIVAIGDYVAGREGWRERGGRGELELRQWSASLASDVASLRPALAIVSRFAGRDRDALLDSMDAIIGATTEGNLERQNRFHRQLESVVGSVA